MVLMTPLTVVAVHCNVADSPSAILPLVKTLTVGEGTTHIKFTSIHKYQWTEI